MAAPRVSDSEHARIKEILTSSIVGLCASVVSSNSQLRVDGLVGITIDQSEVLLISISESYFHGRYSNVGINNTVPMSLYSASCESSALSTTIRDNTTRDKRNVNRRQKRASLHVMDNNTVGERRSVLPVGLISVEEEPRTIKTESVEEEPPSEEQAGIQIENILALDPPCSTDKKTRCRKKPQLGIKARRGRPPRYSSADLNAPPEENERIKQTRDEEEAFCSRWNLNGSFLECAKGDDENGDNFRDNTDTTEVDREFLSREADSNVCSRAVSVATGRHAGSRVELRGIRNKKAGKITGKSKKRKMFFKIAVKSASSPSKTTACENIPLETTKTTSQFKVLTCPKCFSNFNKADHVKEHLLLKHCLLPVIDEQNKCGKGRNPFRPGCALREATEEEVARRRRSKYIRAASKDVHVTKNVAKNVNVRKNVTKNVHVRQKPRAVKSYTASSEGDEDTETLSRNKSKLFDQMKQEVFQCGECPFTNPQLYCVQLHTVMKHAVTTVNSQKQDVGAAAAAEMGQATAIINSGDNEDSVEDTSRKDGDKDSQMM